MGELRARFVTSDTQIWLYLSGNLRGFDVGDEALDEEELRFKCYCNKKGIGIQMLGSAGGLMASSLKKSVELCFVRNAVRLKTSFMG
ncbi:hypothetical protein GBA52_010277 [Prunus armeniaca]|nr:hypothetical protein GBA52_010277 [Prunus armeniaca]